jgi:hypothetical protein
MKFKKNYAESRGIGRGRNPNSIANLKVITSSSMARELQAASIIAKNRNFAALKEMTEQFQCSQDTVKKALATIDIKATDVIRFSMMDAMNKQNWEDASRYASQLAEYEQAKLSRVEQNITNKVEDLSDEELKEILKAEGLPTDD